MENNKKVLFKIDNLKKYFPLKKAFFTDKQRYVHANENINLKIYEGETLGLVGESGSGKSTLGRTIIKIYEQTEGSILYYGKTIEDYAPKYVEDVISKITKEFPKYQNEMAELDKLYEERNAQTESEKIDEYDEKLMYKRRDIQNTYFDMIRIAGGLLTDLNLSEVSNLLNNWYSELRKLAEINFKIEDLELKSKDPKKGAQYMAEAEKLKTEREPQMNKVKEAESKLDELREKLRNNEGFEELESRRDNGINLSKLKESEMRRLRKDLQIIFQDPYSSLDTKLTVGNIIGEGVLAHDMFPSHSAEGYNEYIQDIMDKCGLMPYYIHRYPHQFSGGQRQRIGIARALALEPRFIVCDEAVSALDVSIQSQIINLLQDLKEHNNLTYLFITHDLSVVKYISDRIAVMYLGNIVEIANTEDLFDKPLHPYTQALLKAIPRTDVESNQKLSILEGDIPSAVNPPKGCRFHTRCKYAMDKCATLEPELQVMGPDHLVACHLMDMDEAELQEFINDRDEREINRLEAQEKEVLNIAQEMRSEGENIETR